MMYLLHIYIHLNVYFSGDSLTYFKINLFEVAVIWKKVSCVILKISSHFSLLVLKILFTLFLLSKRLKCQKTCINSEIE